MADKDALLAKEHNISLIPNWLMLNNAIRTGNLQILAKVLKQIKHNPIPVKPNSHSFVFAIWSANPEMLEEVVKIAKRKHGMDYVPDFNSLSYAVLCGNVAMVEKVLEMAAVRKRELQANLSLLNFAVWSNNPQMLDKVYSLPVEHSSHLPHDINAILQKADKAKLNQDVLDAVTASGNPGMLQKMMAVAQKHDLAMPTPNKKTLSQAIKAGNVEMIEEIIKLAHKQGAKLKIDNEIYNASDWSDNPAIRSYLEKFEQE